VVWVAIFGSTPIAAQTNPGSVSRSPGVVLVMAAETADTTEGNKNYAEHLTENFVPSQTGDAYISAFSNRLSEADLSARHGKRKWIPESAVVQAFNDLMKQIGGSSRTDTNIVHELRTSVIEVSPALSTVKSHLSECLPSEAILLMMQLISRNGSSKVWCPPTPGPTGALVQHACEGDYSLVDVSQYLKSHSRSKNRMLFDHVAQMFGI
jgi:hypothetical protein